MSLSPQVIRHDLSEPASATYEAGGIPPLLGESPAIQQLRQHLRRIAPYYRRALLTGERGSGKEAAARQMHGLSPVAGGPFVSCSAAQLAEDGAGIEASRRGTLFVQDLGGLTLAAQELLVRRLLALDKRVRARMVETRLITASESDLKTLSLTGQFRQDLYACISVVELRLPPLRERLEDLDALVEFCLDQTDGAPTPLAADARRRLHGYGWPGNLRELQQVLGQAVEAAAGEGCIEARHLPEMNGTPEAPQQVAEAPSVARLEEVMRRHVVEVLSRCAGNKLKAAELLGISRSTLYRMLDGA
jgi:two-component system response regulator HydG